MRKIILIFVTIVLPCLLCARNDDKSTDMLLREIDGIIRNLTVQKKKHVSPI